MPVGASDGSDTLPANEPNSFGCTTSRSSCCPREFETSTSNALPLPIIQDHQIRIQGSATYLPADYAESAALLSAGTVRKADFVTATRPLEAVAEAFELASSGQHVKVLVTVGER